MRPVTPATAAAIAALTAAAVALPSVRNSFVADDVYVVAERPLLTDPPSLGAVLVEPWWPRWFGGALWRPAAFASFALDYRVSRSPHWFHLVNVLWAAAAAVALTLVAAALFETPVALAAGLLFAVHPVHVEATANVVGRAELMAATGYGLALLCALRAVAGVGRGARARWMIGVALSSALAAASKESGATLPLAVALVLGFRGLRPREVAPAALASMLPVLLYFATRVGVTGGALSVSGIAAGLEGLSLPQRATAMFALSLEWWRLLLLPLRLSADYSPAQVTVAPSLGVPHLLAAGLWGAAALAAWRWRRPAPGMPLGLAWVILTVLPVANLVPTEILVAERTLFLPSWGTAVALASAGAALALTARAKVAMLALLVAAGGVRSALRTNAWRDQEHWYAALQRDAPRSYRTLWMRGTDEFAAGRWGSGERLLRAAIAAAPGLPGPREELALWYARGGLVAQAEALLREAIPLNASRSRPWVLLTDVLLQRGDTAAAAGWAARAAARFPDDPAVMARARRLAGRH